MIRTTLAVAIAAGIAGTSNGAFVSFASDNNANGPTFAGLGQSRTLTDGSAANSDGSVGVSLLVDADGDGPGTAVSYNAIFTMEASFGNSTKFNLGTSTLHSYLGSGVFSFHDARTGSLLLQVSFDGASLTSLSSSVNTLGSSAALQANSDASSIVASGLLADSFGAMSDFGFTLTNLHSRAGSTVAVDRVGTWDGPWISEGSFSGTLVPTPGTLCLASMGLAFAARRRRA